MLIYKTTNLINGLIYIGQKPSMNTEEEFLNSNYYGSGKKIINAIKEFGKENFKREIIDESNDLKELDKIEEKWISYYNSTNPNIGYNIAKRNGAKFWTGAKHSIESVNIIRKKLMGNKNGLGIECSKEKRRKISISNTGKIRTPEMLKNLSDAHIGVHLSDEAKRKLSEYRGEKAGFFNKHHTEETKQLLRDINTGKNHTEETKQLLRDINTGKHAYLKELNLKKSKVVLQYTLDDVFVMEYYSTKEATRCTGINSGSISYCCKGKMKTAGNFKWTYKNE